MTVPSQENTPVVQQEQKPSDKELNFRALEARYQKQLEQERLEKERAIRELQDKIKQRHEEDDSEEDDDYNEPYVEKKKLAKKFNQFNQSTQSEIKKAMEIAKEKAKEELKQELWLENNSDFFQVMQNADKLMEKAPRLAEVILKMPEGFERQKLVYENIKSLGLDRSPQKEPSIQDKINANRKSPYYQPSNVPSPAYNSHQGDFSDNGKANAYKHMQELKSRLRI